MSEPDYDNESGHYVITISLNELIVIMFAMYYAYNFSAFIGRTVLK